MNDTPPIRIYLCGRLAIEHRDTVIHEAEFPARQGRIVWAYLALHRQRPVSREDLAEALWGDDVPERWDSTINGVISRLRALLRRVAVTGSAIRIEGEVGRYALRVPPRTVIDWERAREAIHATDTAMRTGNVMTALTEARVAIEIAARGFLVGESAPWIEGQRRAMQAMQLRALTHTAEAELQRGNPDIAEREARDLLRLDPLWEPGYRLLMRALAESGNRAQVVRVMEECRATLRDQAGLTPAAETEALYRDLALP